MNPSPLMPRQQVPSLDLPLTVGGRYVSGLVQLSPCRIVSGVAQALPLDTHVFVHTEESVEVMEQLVQMSARTCYLHAALSASLPPELVLVLNGQRYEP